MLAALGALFSMGGGSGGSSHPTSSGGSFSGGTLGGINFGQYKSTDQNTIMMVVAVVFVALIVMGKK